MALELEGKVFQVLPEQTGTSQASGKTWRKQAFVIETEEQYPKKVVFNGWNDTVDAITGLQVGDKIKINFRIESREYNERWYTDLTVWKLVKISEQPLTGGSAAPPIEPPADVIYADNNNSVTTNDNTFDNTDVTPDNQDDDLPF
ncbi:MAG: DUF3127 domain-containing protein [Bacteroidales bacterium]|nr:DUF3127 domain-containing protein [Bacteroidales bacterium]